MFDGYRISYGQKGRRALQMNKYQKSLKLVKQLNYASESDKKNEYSTDDVDESHQMLQELVDRLTVSKKPLPQKLFGVTVEVCPTCMHGVTQEETIFHKNKHCGYCGQALDWSEYEPK